jgi:hypothetical protein
MTYKYRKKVKNFHVFKCWMFFKAEGFSCSLCVLYGGLGITKLQFFSKKYPISFAAVNFFQFLIKTLDSELDPDLQIGKMLDPDPH